MRDKQFFFTDHLLNPHKLSPNTTFCYVFYEQAGHLQRSALYSLI